MKKIFNRLTLLLVLCMFSSSRFIGNNDIILKDSSFVEKEQQELSEETKKDPSLDNYLLLKEETEGKIEIQDISKKDEKKDESSSNDESKEDNESSSEAQKEAAITRQSDIIFIVGGILLISLVVIILSVFWIRKHK